MNEDSYTRPAAVAGMFYPEQASELRRAVDDLLAAPGPFPAKGKLLGVIVPHAGYAYSGLTAAHAYRLLKGKVKVTAVVIGPSHREYFDGISVFPGRAFTTPLGVVEVDDRVRGLLVEKMPSLRNSLDGHRTEHSIEVQIPFLQRTVKDLRIVPIVIGNQTKEYCESLGAALAAAAERDEVLLVASSDLSHYYDSETAARLDAVAVESIRSMDYRKLMNDIGEEKTEACGGGPVVSVLFAAKALGADDCTVLHTCNSGATSRDYDRVVGYVSAAMWKTH